MKTSYLFASLTILLFASLFSPPVFPADPTPEPKVNYLFRDSFYLPPSLKLKYDIYESNGFLLVRDAKRGYGSEFAVVTGFEPPALASRVLKNIRTVEEAGTFIEKNGRKIFFERIPIKELPLIQKDGEPHPLYWVGQRAFPTLEEAKAQIAQTKAVIEAGGGQFDRSLELVSEFFPEEETAPTPAQVRANYLAEEELALKMMDWLDIGEQMYGPFTGTPAGERITWQSFGETSFRFTNLSRAQYHSQVGFWSNRIVFKGLRFIGETTIDPYVEATAALETNGLNFPKHLDLVAGAEYRPFQRAAFFDNFQIEGFHVLRFVRAYRLYIQYMERRNITDEITGSADTDLWAGISAFYEWGLDLDPPWAAPKRTSALDWVSDYVWGEYFGNYRWEKTDFAAVDSFNAIVYDTSLLVGIKGPSFKLPPNPINDRFELMPYLRIQHVWNPDWFTLTSQNQLLVSIGIRWMPFRSYQFEHNEWLFKTKLFAEYAGAIGGAQYPGPTDPPDTPHRDWRVGVNVSFNRY